MSRDSITLSQLLAEYDVWNGEISPCTKAAVAVATRRLHAFYVWRYEQEHHAPPPDFDVRVAQITPRDIGHWRAWLAQGERDGFGGWTRRPVSPHTVHSYHAALRQLFRYGLELQPPLIGNNPMEGVANKRPADPLPDVWSRRDVGTMLRAVRRIRWQDHTESLRWTSLIYGLLHGRRINELTTARRDDLRPEQLLVLIRAHNDEPGRSWQWAPKTSVDLPVGISRRWAKILRRLMRACPWQYPHLSRKICENRLRRVGDLSWRQKQMPYGNVNRDFNKIVAQANALRLEKGQPIIATAYPHMGRKTAATQLALSGVHPKITAAIMGWSSVDTGNRFYILAEQEHAIAVGRSSFARIGGAQLGNKGSNLD
jgi:integrase